VRRIGWRPAGAGVALAVLALIVAGCSQVLPLGPAPVSSHLATAIALQPVLSQPRKPAGGCAPGYTALSGSDFPLAAAPVAAPANAAPGLCYRKTGQPATFTSAAVSLYQQPAGPHGQPAVYLLRIALPAGEGPPLTAISTKAFDSRDQLATIVAGKIWNISEVVQPFINGQFEIALPTKSQALQLQRILLPPG
jgi:hypothetical protein